MALWLAERDGRVRFRVQVQPRAATNRVVGEHEAALKVALTAPPVDGAANKLCCRFLADLLGVAKTRVEVVAGHASRRKTLAVDGLDLDDVRRRLMAAAG
ncbi:MAG: DUF167 domain-containing protein [Deltaproteobacteria bacterium]|nr:DUF167 domain-containing protein [Candidatus Anaeroferrophillacea bacterium]